MKKSKGKKILRILGRIFLGFIIFLILLILFIRSPWGQNIIVNKATNFISDKTKTAVEIERLFITSSGNIQLDGLYLEDTKGDTLIYSESLEAEIPLIPIISGNPISIDDVSWKGLKANIYRKDSISGFNYQFLIDAFASDTTATQTEEETAPPQIAVGEIELQKFKINYVDDVSGMNAELDLGDLKLEGKEIDLEKMKFHLAKIKLSQTTINYEQLKAITDSDTSSTGALPFIRVDQFSLNQVTAKYNAPPQGLNALVDIDLFEIDKASANLNLQEVAVNKIALQNSKINAEIDSSKIESSPEETPANKKQEDFKWPDWKVDVASIDFKDNNIYYHQKGVKPQKGKFNPDAIKLSDFSLIAENIQLSKNTEAKLNLNQLKFNEASGFKLDEFNFALALNNEKINVSGLKVKTQKSSLDGNIELTYTEFIKLINQPEKVYFVADLNSFQLNATEAYLFSPELKKNVQFQKLAQQNISGNLLINGSLDKANVKNLNLNWGSKTNINLKGIVSQPINVDQLYLDLNQISASTNRSDIITFLNPDSLGVQIPQDLSLNGNFTGGIEKFKTNININSTSGQIKLQGELNHKKQIAFDSQIEIIELNLGELLQNPDLDKVTFTLKTEGKGDNLNSLNAKLDSDFTKLTYADYDFSNLELKGDIKNGVGDVKLDFKDKNLNLKFHSEIILDSLNPEIKADLNLKGADLYALGLTEKKIRSKVDVKANFKGSANKFRLDTDITNGTIVYNDQAYNLGRVQIDADVDEKSTVAKISSPFINSSLNSNAKPDQISKALSQHVNHYFSKDSTYIQKDSLKNPVQLKLDLKFHETPIISEVFLEGLDRMDTLNAQINFDQAKHNLTAKVSLPHLKYGENLVDSLYLDINSDGKKADFTASFTEIKAGPAQIPRTKINANFKEKQFFLNFESFKKGEKIYALHSVLGGEDRNRTFKILPEEFILNKEKWTIDPNNTVSFGQEKLKFRNFIMSHQGEEVRITNQTNQQTNNWGLEFSNFNLSSLLAYLNPDELLMDGKVDGEIVFIDPFNKFGFTADLNINDFTALQSELGKLSLHAESQNDNTYIVDAGIKGSDVDIDFDGSYKSAIEAPSFDLDLKINKIAMQKIEKFAPDEIKNAEGHLEGEIKLKGTSQDPQFNGHLAFNQASFNVSRLDAKFRLANERINLDNKGIYFNKFAINDADDNSFTVDGDILLDKITNPKFDLNLQADHFTALNSDEEDNDLYYGKVVFDIGADITGNLQFPKAEVSLKIREETDVTYVIPETELSIEKHDGVVVFVNKENPDNILTRKEDDETTATITGIDLALKLKIEPKATFNVIVDKRTDDNLKILGEGDLIFRIARNGRTTLTGKYDISGGHYQMNLYNLVKREFKLDPSSSVSWQGDPMSADLDVRAIYEVKTSASSLMASQTTGASTEAKNRYRQRLPFLVYLDVDGELSQPKLNFNLGMPDDEQGAIGGSVYSRIRQLNQQEDQLNKQVFSLLVLNKFYPDSGSDGSEGGIATVARDNLNDALSDQLNMFSDKITKNTGIDLNFGVNSYTDYQGENAQDRTDLAISAKKKLFNDRVIVEAGSEVNVQGDNRPGEENPVIGNFSIEYLLTKNGRWRLKGFRKSEYENVIDGQVFVSGIALIFTREFNKFKELWDESSFLKKDKSKDDSEKDKENQEGEDSKEKKTNNKATQNEESSE
ncbi:translocation/assembly module TamB domain-containing protein [Psychroflexus halocasei]|uniref:Autotransporter translocation and assembly factor TamB n=1 Tax=Psychroflexus halocasei TaxID=908615 RepID=A0A1H3ZY07_9FLAO|nr:translocation/assembly module TamB domain-containing protein [Psychroflexus halocasei]SEA28597.1 Autotransporter translocation and assembly factor TamB [Psychroflexus halocasei]